jgi:hypothetical protein
MSKLSYICNPEQIESIVDLGDGFFEIKKQGLKHPQYFTKVGGYYVQTRLPKDKFLKLKK